MTGAALLVALVLGAAPPECPRAVRVESGCYLVPPSQVRGCLDAVTERDGCAAELASSLLLRDSAARECAEESAALVEALDGCRATVASLTATEVATAEGVPSWLPWVVGGAALVVGALAGYGLAQIGR